MTKKCIRAPDPAASGQEDAAVAAFLRDLDHPLKPEVELVRRIILGVSPEIREGIKWNAPSFRMADYFATVCVRPRDKVVQLILHKGAKVKDNSTVMKLRDPDGLVRWLAKDRCLVTLGAGKEVQARRAALESIIRECIGQL
jgi:hypothetical protein